ncbi:MAG: hypothetical protein RLZ53_241 [Actinomycetota bacterium]
MKRESGSILPLGIAIIAGTLALGMVFLELGGVQYQTVRNKQLSDVLALKVAGQLVTDGIPPVIGLDYSPTVTGLIAASSKTIGVTAKYISVVSRDGKTMEAVFCTGWESITGLTLGNFGDVCATSRARAIT